MNTTVFFNKRNNFILVSVLFVCLTFSSIYHYSIDDIFVDYISIVCPLITLLLGFLWFLENDEKYLRGLYLFLLGFYISVWTPHSTAYKGYDFYCNQEENISIIPYMGLLLIILALSLSIYYTSKKDLPFYIIILYILGFGLFKIVYGLNLFTISL